MGRDALMLDQLELFNNNKSIQTGDENKLCVKCNNVKLLTSFQSNWHRADGSKSYGNVCKECINASKKITNRLKKETPYPSDDYLCPICNISLEGLKNKIDIDNKSRNRAIWVLDHDHDSGEFRGWLCNVCNSALGWLEDDINYVRRALNYLEKRC